VKTHITHLLAELAARDRAQLVIAAFDAGWSGRAAEPSRSRTMWSRPATKVDLQEGDSMSQPPNRRERADVLVAGNAAGTAALGSTGADADA
jgi:hypothetical protein